MGNFKDDTSLYQLAHKSAPVGIDRDDSHNILGYGPNDAAPGNHIHPETPPHNHYVQPVDNSSNISIPVVTQAMATGTWVLINWAPNISNEAWFTDSGLNPMWVFYRGPHKAWWLITVTINLNTTSTTGMRYLWVYHKDYLTNTQTAIKPIQERATHANKIEAKFLRLVGYQDSFNCQFQHTTGVTVDSITSNPPDIIPGGFTAEFIGLNTPQQLGVG